MNKEKFARRLAALRKEQGWTQGDLARRVGINVASISNYEQARSVPTLDKAYGISCLFDCSLESLMKEVSYSEIMTMYNQPEYKTHFV